MFFDKHVLNRFWSTIPHNLTANYSESNIFGGVCDNQSRSAHVEIPYPAHKPFKVRHGYEDVVNALVQEKDEYNKMKLKASKCVPLLDPDFETKLSANSNELLGVPKRLLDFYAMKDPDKYFDTNYNIYYTNGFLEHISVNGCDYLVRPNYKNKLCLSNVTDTSSDIIKIGFNGESPIFGIKSTTTATGDTLLTVREKCNINILEVINLDDVVVHFFKSNSKPIFDAKLNKDNINNLGVISANSVFDLHDLQKKIIVHEYEWKNKVIEPFQQFDFLDYNTIVLMDRKTVRLIDLRTKEVTGVQDPELQGCNALCNFRIDGDHILLASRHFVVRTELRTLGKYLHFPHMLKTAPCYMDLIQTDDNSKYLCLAGQNSDDKILFSGNSVFSLPSNVPSLSKALRTCQLHRDLLLMNGLQERLQYSTAGLKLLKINNDLILCSANSLGEIFVQKVLKNPQDENLEESLDKLFSWLHLTRKPKPELVITNMEDASKARFALNEPISQDSSESVEAGVANAFLDKFENVYDLDSVAELAKSFLEVWVGDDEEEEKNEEKLVMEKKTAKTDKKTKLPETEPNEKVNFWIQMQDFDDDALQE